MTATGALVASFLPHRGLGATVLGLHERHTGFGRGPGSRKCPYAVGGVLHCATMNCKRVSTTCALRAPESARRALGTVQRSPRCLCHRQRLHQLQRGV